MPGADRATARTVAVIVLILLAGVALRGHLPGTRSTADDPAGGGPAPLVAVVVMLALSVAVIAVSVLSRSRRPVSRPDTSEDLIRDRAGERRPWTWRMALVLAGALLVWLLIVLTLMRISGWLDVAVDQPQAPSPPGPDASAVAEPPPPPAEATGSTVMLVAFTCAAAFFVLLTVFAVVNRRRAQPRPAPAATAPADDAAVPESGTQSLARAAERGLVEIGNLSREPREAIIACYAAMERELGKAPGAMPQDSDTPAEVLARAVDRRLLRGESATELVDLFEEARFSTHTMGEDHREAAVRVLRLVLGELQGAA